MAENKPNKENKKAIKKIDRDFKRFKKQMEENAKDKDFIKLPNVLNAIAKEQMKPMGHEIWNALMTVFQHAQDYNPYSNKSRMLPNGTVLWQSDTFVMSEHLEPIFLNSLSNGRFLHINTGTHGAKDGSNNFWKTNKIKKRLEEDAKFSNDWVTGANNFMNQDLSALSEKFKNIKDQTYFSITFVTEDSPPVYPEHTDVLDTWCFSCKFPRCCKNIMNQLQSFIHQARFWKTKQEEEKVFIINQLLTYFEKEQKKCKCKTDNVFHQFLNGLKRIFVPQEVIDSIRQYAIDRYWQNVEDTALLTNKQIYTKNIFFDIIQYAFDHIAEVPQKNYNPREDSQKIKTPKIKYTPIEKIPDKTIIVKKDIEKVEAKERKVVQKMEIEFIKHHQKEKKFKRGRKFDIDNNGFKHKFSQIPYGTGQVIFGRKSKKGKLDFAVNKKALFVSRQTLLIKFMDNKFYATDYATNYPSCMNVNPEVPILLEKGMMLFIGNANNNRQFLKISEITQPKGRQSFSRKIKDLRSYTKMFEIQNYKQISESHINEDAEITAGLSFQGQRMFSSQSLGKKEEYKLVINNLSNNNSKHTFVLQEGQLHATIPILHEGYEHQNNYSQKLEIYLGIQLDSEEQRWGTIHFTQQNGWFVVGSKAGELMDEHLRLVLKTPDQFMKQQPSDPILIKNGMQFCLAGDYIFQCNVEDAEEQIRESDEDSDDSDEFDDDNE